MTTLRALALALVLALRALVLAEDFTEQCPARCVCKWQSGNKAADCTGAGLSLVPTLSADIQILELSDNPLYEIRKRAFRDVGLSNLKKLFLRACRLQSLHRDALSGLAILIELDLSGNDLAHLSPDTFRGTDKIRWIFLNHNKLDKLDDGLFRSLPYLQKVELSDNRLFRLGAKTFSDVPKLSILKLSGNKLAHVKLETFSELSALSSLDLHNNPWRCDCHLQPFRAWALQRKLYTSPTACAEPPQLAGRMWNELDASDLACKPSVVQPAPGAVMRPATDANVTLACLVSGDPLPDASWVLDSRVLTSRSDARYRLAEESREATKWLNLTIRGARPADAGQYKCVAQNAGGVDERSVLLTVSRGGDARGDAALLPLLGGVCAGAALLALAAAAACCCLRRRAAADKLRRAGAGAGGDALLERSVIPEMEKSLLVNPVTKPPRRAAEPRHLDTALDATLLDASLLDATLLDDDSVFAAREDSLARLERLDPRACPPDLLAFPPRAPASPAASAASAAPLLSPGFRTLPYSRAHSPAQPAVAPRRGYVTIPRRPRAPSWASAASAPAACAEPLYDNLGLRTTADGSSVLSLTRAGAEASPMRGRPLPPAPRAARTTPPKPPPKPKKKSPDSAQPLFEDEGEDGTEV